MRRAISRMTPILSPFYKVRDTPDRLPCCIEKTKRGSKKQLVDGWMVILLFCHLLAKTLLPNSPTLLPFHTFLTTVSPLPSTGSLFLPIVIHVFSLSLAPSLRHPSSTMLPFPSLLYSLLLHAIFSQNFVVWGFLVLTKIYALIVPLLVLCPSCTCLPMDFSLVKDAPPSPIILCGITKKEREK